MICKSIIQAFSIFTTAFVTSTIVLAYDGDARICYIEKGSRMIKPVLNGNTVGVGYRDNEEGRAKCTEDYYNSRNGFICTQGNYGFAHFGALSKNDDQAIGLKSGFSKSDTSRAHCLEAALRSSKNFICGWNGRGYQIFNSAGVAIGSYVGFAENESARQRCINFASNDRQVVCSWNGIGYSTYDFNGNELKRFPKEKMEDCSTEAQKY